MKVEVISPRVGEPGAVIDLDPETVDVDHLIDNGFVKPHKTQTKKDKE